MKSGKRESYRFEYAFSVMFTFEGKYYHECCLVDSNNIDEALLLLDLPNATTTRYIAAKRLAESEITYKAQQQNMSINMYSSLGTLIPISPTILNPYWN